MKKLTVKEAILVALEESKKALTYTEVFDCIEKSNLYDFKDAKTPRDTVSAQLGSFIRHDDLRVKRIKKKNGFVYYLSKFESEIGDTDAQVEVPDKNLSIKAKAYQERDLHVLLSSYLKGQGIYAKTIFHEKSNSKDKQQKWVHPDVVGVSFSDIKEKMLKHY